VCVCVCVWVGVCVCVCTYVCVSVLNPARVGVLRMMRCFCASISVSIYSVCVDDPCVYASSICIFKPCLCSLCMNPIHSHFFAAFEVAINRHRCDAAIRRSDHNLLKGRVPDVTNGKDTRHRRGHFVVHHNTTIFLELNFLVCEKVSNGS